MTAAETMNRTMGAYESLINDATHKNFITRGLVKPMIFAAVTVAEQVAADEDTAMKIQQQRTHLSSLI